MTNQTPPVLTEFTRGEIVESQHRGYVCVVDSKGEILYSKGETSAVTFLRSSTKPLQALTPIVTGAVERYGLTDAETAIICGSHGGEPFHLETVRSILKKAGLSTDLLKCGIHPPLDKTARQALCKSNSKPEPLHHNCSGKHAGMLISAKHLGASLDDYLEIDHPVQQHILKTIALFAGIDVSSIKLGIDGCAAPVHAVTMKEGALTFARFIDPVGIPPEYARAAKYAARVMRMYPEMIGANQDRICTELMRVGRNYELTVKAGAEGYYIAGWRDTTTGKGIGLSVKMEDGAERARNPVTIEILQKFGVLPENLSEAVKPFASGKIRNFCGNEVGEIRTRLE